MLWKVLHSICNMQYALNMQYVGSRQSMMARPLLYSNLTPQIWIWRSDNGIMVVYILNSPIMENILEEYR